MWRGYPKCLTSQYIIYLLVIAAKAICFLTFVISIIEQCLRFVGRVYDDWSHVPNVGRNFLVPHFWYFIGREMS